MLNILVAYPYFRKLKKETIEELKRPEVRFLMDSGAFTAWKSGQPIELDEYTDFLDSLTFEPWRYFTLDVIGDGEGTKKNYYELLNRGYKPVPIYTRGENIKMIDEYFETSDVVAIGGLVQTKGNKGFVKNILQKYPNKKFHLLGFTNHNFISYFKPYMCDSSSWTSGGRFKIARLYMGKGRFVSINKETFKTKPSLEIIKRLQYYEIDYQKLAYEEYWITRWKHDLPFEMLQSMSYIHYQQDLKKYFDINYFLASGSDLLNICLIENYLKLKRKGIV